MRSPQNILKIIAGLKETGLDVRGDGGAIIVYGELEDVASLAEWPPELKDAMERDQKAREALYEQASKPGNRKWERGSDDAEKAAEALRYSDKSAIMHTARHRARYRKNSDKVRLFSDRIDFVS
jgi:hypothetical protein